MNNDNPRDNMPVRHMVAGLEEFIKQCKRENVEHLARIGGHQSDLMRHHVLGLGYTLGDQEFIVRAIDTCSMLMIENIHVIQEAMTYVQYIDVGLEYEYPTVTEKDFLEYAGALEFSFPNKLKEKVLDLFKTHYSYFVGRK